MDNRNNIDLADAFKQLLAENKSQQARLEDAERAIKSRDSEIDVLHGMLSEANAYRSSMDNQLAELATLKHYLQNLQQQVAGAVYMTAGRQQRVPDTVSLEQQLESLKTEYAYLQSQLTELQSQLLDVNSRNLLLQQQNSRIAELESLLENATEEINNLRQRYKPPGKWPF